MRELLQIGVADAQPPHPILALGDVMHDRQRRAVGPVGQPGQPDLGPKDRPIRAAHRHVSGVGEAHLVVRVGVLQRQASRDQLAQHVALEAVGPHVEGRVGAGVGRRHPPIGGDHQHGHWADFEHHVELLAALGQGPIGAQLLGDVEREPEQIGARTERQRHLPRADEPSAHGGRVDRLLGDVDQLPRVEGLAVLGQEELGLLRREEVEVRAAEDVGGGQPPQLLGPLVPRDKDADAGGVVLGEHGERQRIDDGLQEGTTAFVGRCGERRHLIH